MEKSLKPLLVFAVLFMFAGAVLLALFFGVLNVEASGPSSRAEDGASPDTAETATAAEELPESQLREAIDRVHEQTAIRGGLVVRDEETGQEIAVDSDFTVRAASTSKIAIAMGRFRMETLGGIPVTQNDYDMIHASLAYSDNWATRQIYNQFGPTEDARYQALLEIYRLLGMDQIEESAGWGQTLVTARDETKLIDALRTPPDWLGASAAQTIRDDMRISAEDYDESQEFGVGSFVQHEGLDTADVYLKNGWLAETSGQWSVTSTGAVHAPGCDLTVSITTFGGAEPEDGMEAATDIAEPLVDWCASQ